MSHRFKFNDGHSNTWQCESPAVIREEGQTGSSGFRGILGRETSDLIVDIFSYVH